MDNKSIKLPDGYSWDTVGITQNILTAWVTETDKNITSINDGPTKVNVEEYLKIGNRLSVQNGSIKIGDNISLIEVTAQATSNWNTGIVGNLGISIIKNGVEYCRTYATNQTNFKMISAILAGIIIEVSKDDVIDLGILPSSTGLVKLRNYDDHYESYITVKVLK